MKICLIPGHGPIRDKGAENRDGTNELEWNQDLVRRIATHLQGKAGVTIVHRSQERLSPVHMINTTNADIAIEFHCNAANGTATGTEMIYYPSSRAGKALAEKLQKAVVSVLGLKDRGVREPFDGRGNRFLAGTRMPAVIAESFFIDNSSDLAVGNAKKDLLALAYADAILSLPIPPA